MYPTASFAIFFWGGIGEFFDAHPALPILLIAASLFCAGYSILARGDKTSAFLWMLWAVVIAGGFSIGAFFTKMWLASLVALVLCVIEIWLMKRWFGGKSR